VRKSEDLTRASVASQRNRRERPAVEQRCDGGDQPAADGGMTVEEVREAREDDPAGHAFRQRFPERPGAQSGRPRLLPALLTRERHTRSVAVPAGYALHDRARAIKQTKKAGAGAINALERRRPESTPTRPATPPARTRRA
jgi:hypothetical protein